MRDALLVAVLGNFVFVVVSRVAVAVLTSLSNETLENVMIGTALIVTVPVAVIVFRTMRRRGWDLVAWVLSLAAAYGCFIGCIATFYLLLRPVVESR